MKKSLFFCLLTVLCLVHNVYAQVKIGNNPTTIGSGSLLELESTTKGLVLPRMTGAQMNTISSPVAGMFIYNTDSSCICQYTGTAWRSLCGSGIGAPKIDWHILGNAGTVDGTNFLGTTDNIPFNIRVNNQKAGRIDNTGNNAFFGYQAGNANTTGLRNSFFGHQAGYNSTGNNNTAFGFSSGLTNTTGGNNTFLGHSADATANNFTNATAIGYNAKVGASNSLVLGGTGADAVNVGIGTTTPGSKLHVEGSVKIVDGTQGTGKVLTSDANGLASWAPSTSMGYRTLVTKSADQVLNSASWADISELSFPVTAGTTYRFTAIISYTATGTGEGLNFAVSGPASPTFLAYTYTCPNGSNSQYMWNSTAYDQHVGNSNSLLNNVAVIHGVITPSANGTFILRYDEERANMHTIKAGSSLEYW